MVLIRRPVLEGIAAILLMLAGAGAFSQQSRKPQAQPEPPATQMYPHSEQAYSLSPAKLAEAIALNRIRVALEFAGPIWALLVLWWLLASTRAARLEAWTREKTKRGWLQGLLFFALIIVILTIASLPLDAIAHVAGLHYKISVQGWASWFGDAGKGLAVAIAIGAPVALFFNWIVRKSPRRYWIWIWLICLPLILLSVFLAPLVLDPLFNKFSPLEQSHPALVQKLEEVVARTGLKIPPSRMFLMNASAKSNGFNAYVTGIGSSKRFVMWDTTMDRMPDDEIMFIFGHESGHYVLNHIPKGIVLSMVGLLFLFWICAHFANWLVQRFGERWQVRSLASRAGFLTLFFAFSIGGFFSTPSSNAVSRHFEHEADIYGQEAIHGLVPDPQKTAVSSFNHLGEAWLDDPHPNCFIEFWLYDHPSVQQRAEFAEHYDPWANGGHGKFFAR